MDWDRSGRRSLRLRVRLLLGIGVVVTSCENSSPPRDALVLQALPPIGLGIHEGPAAFGDIADLELSADGSVYVLDQLGRAVQVFQLDGSHVRTIGRQGSGPGEFENPLAMAWSPSGELWVVDPASDRYSVFSSEGAFVATYSRPVGGIVLPWPGGFSESGLLYDVAFEFGPDGPVMWLVEFEIEGGSLTERSRQELPSADVETFGFENAEVGLVLPVPLTSQPLARVGPDGSLWLTDTGDPWVHRRTLGADDIVTFGADFEPPLVTEEDREAALDTEGARELRALGGAEVMARFAARIPTTKPHLAGFFLDDDGQLWVMRSTSGPQSRSSTQLDVYDPSGTLVGTTEATMLSDPWPRLRDGVLAGVARDSLGVEFVALYRLVGSY